MKKPSILIALLLSIASISTASMLFLRGSPTSSNYRTAAQAPIDFRWGEGSEAGVPDSAADEKMRVALGNDEETFVFAGKCANGESYRLFSYKKYVHGLSQSYYDYDGPVGQGTVQSATAPKIMAVRICHKLAEIVSENLFQ
ncbi:hypothetical protein [Limnohabitans sp. JirII-29]|uniref:hypothetical protein n=1 Tax=Limnohabitans sp. JirII-29 TaxID=1835756 RepID=UPI0011B1FA21|nr:hypothetical protein [Limnohabitans sp. JirII-29]